MLTFRLYQTIRFNRPIVKGKDSIVPGGYEMTVSTRFGKKHSIQFDFEDYEGHIDKSDPCILHAMQKNPDYNTFPDMKKLTERMLSHIERIDEWYLDVETMGPTTDEERLIPIEITDAEFVVIGKKKNKHHVIPKDILKTIM